MRFIILCAYFVFLVAGAAFAETTRCPYAGGDSCKEWQFEQFENELAELIAGRSVWIDSMPEQLRADAHAALYEAQKQWIKFRDAECLRKLTWSFATARGRRGFLANCLLNMTFHRRNDLQEAYKFKPR